LAKKRAEIASGGAILPASRAPENRQLRGGQFSF